MEQTATELHNIFGGTIPEKVLNMGDWNKSPLKFFSRYDGPYKNVEVVIGNLALRKIMSKNFEYMSRNLFFISAFGRFLLGSDKIESVLQAEEIAEKTLANAMAAVERRIEHAKTLLSANDIKDEAQTTKQNIMLVPLTSPGARKYVELLIKADEFYNLNAILWIDGQIDSTNKFQNESVVRKEVQSAVKGIANQFGYILNLTRKKDAAEAAKAGEHNEEQLASQAVEEVASLGTVAVSPTIPVAPEAGTSEAESKTTGKKTAGKKADTAAVTA